MIHLNTVKMLQISKESYIYGRFLGLYNAGKTTLLPVFRSIKSHNVLQSELPLIFCLALHLHQKLSITLKNAIKVSHITSIGHNTAALTEPICITRFALMFYRSTTLVKATQLACFKRRTGFIGNVLFFLFKCFFYFHLVFIYLHGK